VKEAGELREEIDQAEKELKKLGEANQEVSTEK